MALGHLADYLAPVHIPSFDEFAQSGVYFLHLDGVVVYVGQAVDMRRRIADHLADSSKVFDAASGIPFPAADLLKWERHYIKKLVPKYNQCAFVKSLRHARVDGDPDGIFLKRKPRWRKGPSPEYFDRLQEL